MQGPVADGGRTPAGRVAAVTAVARASALIRAVTPSWRWTRWGRTAGRGRSVRGPRGGWIAGTARRASAGGAGAKAPPPAGTVPPCPECRAGALSIVIG
ncbi:hypothetical protein Slala03_35500 [Streptomyces lavendulae subsp. lavendulae]|nr:hypothetical protein Slala03_35500 [Streptomyces lavendulae subsp. lavendulae]